MDTTKVDFVKNSDPGSYAANRFMVVFGPPNYSPDIHIQATRQGNTIPVQWSLSPEQGVVSYELQRSTDGVNFTTVYTTQALNTGIVYSWTDVNPEAGTNYYRV